VCDAEFKASPEVAFARSIYEDDSKASSSTVLEDPVPSETKQRDRFKGKNTDAQSSPTRKLRPYIPGFMPEEPVAAVAAAAAAVPASSWDFYSLLLDSEGHWDWEKAMGLFQGIVDYLAPLL
jgi:hypothetical protein